MSQSLTPTPTLLTPSLPPKTLVGIDLITFTSTPNFHGIRNLPSGWHFLYTGTTEGLSLRVGGWFYIDTKDTNKRSGGGGESQSDILIWKWDENTECLEPLGPEQAGEGMKYRANIGGVWGTGGLFGYRSRVPVPVSAGGSGALQKAGAGGGAGIAEVDEEDEEEGRREWAALTDSLSEALLSRITGSPSVDWEGRTRWAVTSGSTAKMDDDDIPGLEDPNPASTSEGPTTSTPATVTQPQPQPLPESNTKRPFSFLPIDLKMTWRSGAIGRERTEAARDKSWALGEIIHSISSSDDRAGEAQILGELQFTFLMGLTLMNFSCLQQWKRLLRLILTCRSAIITRANLISSALRLLLTQLKRCDDVEGGLLDQMGNEGGAEGSEFLRKLLRGFRIAMYEVLEDGEQSAIDSPVKREFEKLEEWVKNEFDWELDRDKVLRRGMVQLEDGEEVELEIDDHEEEDEYQPVVVDLGGDMDGNNDQDIVVDDDDDDGDMRY
ncbi:AAR2 splicing factor family protein [Aspergillus stella-maris]|uniref:AAR2 splicing factor family protein n=1 Tax=Aspergillus stella-maris TaxID=1810926 RepID=UPI003CCCEB11